MDPETSNFRAEPWLLRLCEQLEECQTVEDIRGVLDGLDQGILSQNRFEYVLDQLQGAPLQPNRLAELVLSHSNWSEPLSTWLLESFAAFPEGFAETPQAKIIEKLALCLNFMHVPGVAAPSRAAILRAQLFQTALSQLLSFRATFSTGDAEELVEGPGTRLFRTDIQQSHQNSRKRGSNAPTKSGGQNPLGSLKIAEPKSAEEARGSARELLEALRRDLEGYLTTLKEPEVAQAIQRLSVCQRPGDRIQPQAQKDADVEEDEAETPATHDPTEGGANAYAAMQTMKASLYFESAKGLGEWKILVSSRADGDLRAARRRDRKEFGIIVKKIIELSNGHFSKDNQKQINKGNLDFPVFEAKMTNNARLVYQVDCIPDFDTETERQVIKIFGVYSHSQLDKRLWKSIGYQLASRGKEYRYKCTFRNRPAVTGDNVVMPACFPHSEQDSREPVTLPEIPKEDMEEVHSLLVLEKYVTLSKELFTSIWADLDVAHVFDVSPQEKEIIEHAHSCYVIGRSGTGKTTTMLFKMLGIERAYSQQSEAAVVVRKPRQMFVTHSRVLATRVEEYFNKLQESLAAAKKTKEELKAMSERRKTVEEDEEVFDLNDDAQWKLGLPTKFSLLQDEHFPLFLTFEKLVGMLEADLDLHETEKPFKGQLVTYDLFLGKYWPRFSQNLTKNLDPALVFNEFLGVIEGSEEALEAGVRFLDQGAYENLSHRTQHVFARQRSRVYALYLAYRQRKLQRDDYDAADRIHSILESFEAWSKPQTGTKPSPSKGLASSIGKVDHLYVDEAQDNLLIDSMVLRSLCRNPNGLFWAGDSAQTIAIGSSFRFNDLKAFLYRLEQRREQRLVKNGVSVRQSDLRTFQLTVNYRSHAGILRCATTVIEVISTLWPYSIDKLAPEHGVVDGAKPTFFSGEDSTNIHYEPFLRGNSGERVEFGARQCILVRDERAKAELQDKVGNIGTIMTLYESKGLEFDDVLLYKFFEDSSVELGPWRRIFSAFLSNGSDLGLLVANADQYVSVCSELKFLYVAITRARKNLWIVDFSRKAEPVKALWESKALVEVWKPGDKMPRLAVSSSSGEWKTTARVFFDNQRYLQAMHAYQRAGREREAQIAHSYYLEERALRVHDDANARRTALCEAGLSFMNCVETAKTKERPIFLRKAGECYEAAGNCAGILEDFGKAAAAYHALEDYNTSVKLYRKGVMFDEAVDTIRQHSADVDPALADSVIDVAKLYYFKNEDIEKAEALFETVEDKLEYLDGNVLLDNCHASALVAIGKHRDAAEVHVKEGRFLEAIETLLLDKSNKNSLRQANGYIIDGLWRTVSFAQQVQGGDHPALKFFELALKIDPTTLSTNENKELEIFRVLLSSKSRNPTSLLELARSFLGRNDACNKLRALLCFDYYFTSFPSTENITNVALAMILDDFLAYVRLFHHVIRSLDVASPETQRVFGFGPASTENAYRIGEGSWLYQQAITSNTHIINRDERSITLLSRETKCLLTSTLFVRLRNRIRDQNRFCHGIHAFSPCMEFIVNRSCRRSNCPHLHIDPPLITPGWLQAQIRIHSLQILIYQVYHAITFYGKSTIYERRYWISRLFETLCPPCHQLGTYNILHLASVPEGYPALEICKVWGLDILHTRGLSIDPKMLNSMYEMAHVTVLLDSGRSRVHLAQAPLLNIFQSSPALFRSQGHIYTLPELYHSVRAEDRTFISGGIVFLQHIVQSKTMQMDIGLLCHLVEYLCGSIIIARRGFNLHNVTLPRGWLLHFLRHVRAAQGEYQLGPSLLQSCKVLLEDLIRGGDRAGYLLSGNRDVSHLPIVRNLFVHRICRALGLIGYNINHPGIRDDILSIYKVLDAAPVHHPTFRSFIRPRHWGHIHRAVQTSFTSSQLEEMIQLYSRDRVFPDQYPPPAGVRRVLFSTAKEAISTLERPIGTTQEDPIGPQVGRALESDRLGQDEHMEVETIGLGDPTDIRPTTVILPPLETKGIPEEQMVVARKLVARFKQAKALRARKSVIQQACDSYFAECFAASLSLSWEGRTLYRAVYLGVLPHLLACINAVESYTEAAKIEIKASFQCSDAGEALEVLNRKNVELGSVMKETKRLRTILQPKSDHHQRYDVEHLKAPLLALKRLIERVQGAGTDLDTDFSIQLADAVLFPKARVKKQKALSKPKPELTRKPQLVIIDDATPFYWDDESDDGRSSQSAPGMLLTSDHALAASVIGAAYRRRLQATEHKTSGSKKPYDSFFRQCLEVSAAIQWPHNSHYRRVYLGIVPHLLVYLEDVEFYARIAKRKANKLLLGSAGGGDLDTTVANRDALGSIHKTSVLLRKKLDPRSDIHTSQDGRQLKDAMESVKGIMDMVGDAVRIKVEFNFQVAISELR